MPRLISSRRLTAVTSRLARRSFTAAEGNIERRASNLTTMVSSSCGLKPTTLLAKSANRSLPYISSSFSSLHRFISTSTSSSIPTISRGITTTTTTTTVFRTSPRLFSSLVRPSLSTQQHQQQQQQQQQQQSLPRNPSISTPNPLQSALLFRRSFSTSTSLSAPRNTYNPSHKIRKRRHGFLSRVRTRKGRALLTRRRLKGRQNLSH